MTNEFRKQVLLLAIAILLGFSLIGCSLSNGLDEPRGGTQSEVSAPPTTSSDSKMAKMNMTQKPSSSGVKETTTSSIPNQIVIENFSFEPATLTVKAGTKVSWVNRDDEPHTATDTDKRFNSKTLDTDDQFSFTFNEPGTYSYYCALHPKMTGQIIVK